MNQGSPATQELREAQMGPAVRGFRAVRGFPAVWAPPAVRAPPAVWACRVRVRRTALEWAAVRALHTVRGPRTQVARAIRAHCCGGLAHRGGTRELRMHPECRHRGLACCACREFRSHPEFRYATQGVPVARLRRRAIRGLPVVQGLRGLRAHRFATRKVLVRGSLGLRSLAGHLVARRLLVVRGRSRAMEELCATRGRPAVRELRTIRDCRGPRMRRRALDPRTPRGFLVIQQHRAVRERHSTRVPRAGRGRRGRRNASRQDLRAHASERTQRPLRTRDRLDIPGAVPRPGRPAREHQELRKPGYRRAGPG